MIKKNSISQASIELQYFEVVKAAENVGIDIESYGKQELIDMFTGRWLRGRENKHSVEEKEKETREGKGKGRGKGKGQRSNPEFKAPRHEFEEMEYEKKLKEREERIEREHQRKLRSLEHSAHTYGTPTKYTPMKNLKGDEQGEYKDEVPAVLQNRHEQELDIIYKRESR